MFFRVTEVTEFCPVSSHSNALTTRVVRARDPSSKDTRAAPVRPHLHHDENSCCSTVGCASSPPLRCGSSPPPRHRTIRSSFFNAVALDARLDRALPTLTFPSRRPPTTSEAHLPSIRVPSVRRPVLCRGGSRRAGSPNQQTTSSKTLRGATTLDRTFSAAASRPKIREVEARKPPASDLTLTFDSPNRRLSS